MRTSTLKFIARTILATAVFSAAAVFALYVAALLGSQAAMTVLLVVILPEVNLASAMQPESASLFPGSLELTLVVAALQMAFLLTVLILGATLALRRVMTAPRGENTDSS